MLVLLGAVLLVPKKWAATVILVTVFLMTTLVQFGVVEANPWIGLGNLEPSINIVSPDGVKICLETSISIEVIVNPYWSNRKFIDIYYSLDGGSNITLSITTYENSTDIYGLGTLDNLTDGYHTMEAYSTDTQGNTISNLVIFLVDTVAPEITNLSVNNTDSGDRLLSFTADEVARWVGYSLDNQENVTVFADYVVLGDLSFGSHNVTVYVADKAGNVGASETLFFTVEPFPTIPVVAGIGTIASVGVGLLVYFKKRKQ